MICYHDMTFCPYWLVCLHGGDCIRRLSPAVKADSAKIGIPIARFAEEPDCYCPIKEPDNG